MQNEVTQRGMKGRPRGSVTFYLLVVLALINLIAAGTVLGIGLTRMQHASEEIVRRTQNITLANQIMAIARDSETGQRGFFLTGRDNYLEPYREAVSEAPDTLRKFYALKLDPSQVSLRRAIHKSFDEKLDVNTRTIAMYREGNRADAISVVQTGLGKQVMDRLRAQVTAFESHERRALVAAEARSARAMRVALILTLVGSIAFIGSGALMYAAVRRARADAGAQLARASSADQRFKATFDQSGVGFMHIDREGRPLLVNDALCAMTGYSRHDFVTAGPESPALPANLFSNKSLCDALLGGEIESYRNERLARTKDGRDIFLVSVVSSVRDDRGEIVFLSAIISDLTEQYNAEKNLRDSQERLRRLQDEFAHVARVNDMGEMAAAIAHEVNQPLTAITNYMSVASKLAGQLGNESDLPMILQRASDQAMRAGQIVKRMRGFVEHGEVVRQIEHVGGLIDSAVEMTLIGTDRDAVEIVRGVQADAALVCVDPIQFQQALIILMRNAIEAFSTAQCPGKCRIEITSSVDVGARNVIVDVSDNGPGLDAERSKDVFKPFVTSKPGNMGMGLSIAQRLIDSHGGRLTLEQQKTAGATFRIVIPLVENDLDQAA